jgi:anaerobic magnesium-protoporphyrin IX monomethyl ester cyclase
MKILFTHSYFYKRDPKQWRFKQPYPPLGTLLAASVMRAQGHDVALLDNNLKDGPHVIVPALTEHRPQYVVIYDDGFNYLTKMCLTVMRDAAFVMAEESRKHGCTVIICSSDATDHYEKYFQHHVDYVIRGEGEETLKQLIGTLEKDGDVSAVQGLAFQKNGATILTPARPVLRDLDALPMPAWDLVDMEAYRTLWLKHHGYFSLNLATTRGCPFKCNWCAKPIYGNRYTSRSPQHVVDEIAFLLEHHRPDHFWMSDDIFGLRPGWVQEFNRIVKERKLSFTYKIQSRVDLLLEDEVIDALAASGARTVWVGAESGSQSVLDAMDKGTTVEQIYDATRLLKTHGIAVGFFLQFGYPGETETDIQATLRMVLELMPEEVGISISYPLPGTKFYENVKGQLLEKQNWSDSDDLAMLFKSTFNNAYYKALHRYVHYVYRKQKGYASLKKLMRSPLRLTYRDLKQGLGTFYFGARVTLLSKRLRILKDSTIPNQR